ncbi:MAG: hypothetical protein V4558_07320 [Gemmatimonadota bacterium]
MKNSVAVNALRRYHESAPWRLAELIELADGLMVDAGLPREKPTTERTVRFYVARGVIHPPYGRGAGSSWGYRHLIDLVAVRLSQQAGETLETIAEFRTRAGETGLEQMVAERLGAAFFRPRLVRDANPVPEPLPPLSAEWQRISLGEGAELHLAAGHPLLADDPRLRALVTQLRGLIHPSLPESP